MRTRRADRGHRGLYVRGGVALFVWFAAWSLSGAVHAPALGSPVCREMPDATTEDYLTGVACPPEGFREALGYDPVLVHTRYGWRFTRPAWADGRCNGPITRLSERMAFADACRTHDYGYDLVRFGVGDRPAADDLLYHDMMVACAERDALTGGGCRALANWTKATLQVGDATGFDPEPVDRP